MSITEKILDLIRETSSSLPEDVEKALRRAMRREEASSSAKVVLKTILDNCALARKASTPLCQDTGTLTFFVKPAAPAAKPEGERPVLKDDRKNNK